jgi:hypothetical protein
MLGIGIGINKYKYVFGDGGTVSFFVRPAGTIYGDSSGTSYANAWSGFSSINWTLLANKTLNVCGTHTQRLLVQQNNVTIVGNNILGAGIINGQSTRQCINVTSYNNITINGITCNNGLLDNIIFENSIGNIVNDSTFDTSTNQTAQHQGAICEVEYNNCIFKNGADDGISSHDSATVITANNCTFQGNVQGINTISSGIVYANDCNFISNTQDLKADTSSIIVANRCTLRGQVVANSSQALQLNNCLLLSGETLISDVGTILINGCKYMGASTISSYQTNITKVQILRSYFERTTALKIRNFANAVFNVEYCTFIHKGGLDDFSILTQGTGTSTINNCNFIGSANLGWGIQAQGRLNVKNSIFTNLKLCVNPNGTNGIVTFENCNTFNNLFININQGGGTFSNTNNITTNPLFTNIATLDFRLQAGSPCLNSGATLTNAKGILSADWASTIPTVTTINQSGAWDRGACIQ